ncbi:hypothetical protein DFH06DRAFT_1332756 [Mycena polygramma]|nr:hypothetical protein DFH06DRAFT_1332756 [Mycena polygramma]
METKTGRRFVPEIHEDNPWNVIYMGNVYQRRFPAMEVAAGRGRYQAGWYSYLPHTFKWCAVPAPVPPPARTQLTKEWGWGRTLSSHDTAEALCLHARTRYHRTKRLSFPRSSCHACTVTGAYTPASFCLWLAPKSLPAQQHIHTRTLPLRSPPAQSLERTTHSFSCLTVTPVSNDAHNRASCVAYSACAVRMSILAHFLLPVTQHAAFCIRHSAATLVERRTDARTEAPTSEVLDSSSFSLSTIVISYCICFFSIL